MKLSALCLAGFAAGTLAKCVRKPCTGTCVAAVDAAFCSSYLSLEAVTETVTETATVTSVQTSIETSFDVVTLTTLTTTITGPAATVYAKREEAPSADPASSVLAQCGNAASMVSSACSCILPSTTASTVTVVETVTATAAAEETITTTETLTTGATATEYATPTVTVTQPIVNGNFESYLSTGNILPWTMSTPTTGGQVQMVNGVNPCTSGGAYCAGGQVVVRVYPPTSGAGYISLQESFTAKASSTYNLSFMYRCLNYDANTRIDVYFKGNKIGTTNGCVNSAAFTRVTSGIQFTTDETGAGLLEVRFMNPSRLPFLYLYADDFQATRVQ